MYSAKYLQIMSIIIGITNLFPILMIGVLYCYKNIPSPSPNFNPHKYATNQTIQCLCITSKINIFFDVLLIQTFGIIIRYIIIIIIIIFV